MYTNQLYLHTLTATTPKITSREQLQDCPAGPVANSAPSAGGLGSIAGQGTRSHVPQLKVLSAVTKHSQIITKKRKNSIYNSIRIIRGFSSGSDSSKSACSVGDKALTPGLG